MILRIVTRDHELSAERHNQFKLAVPAELTRIESPCFNFCARRVFWYRLSYLNSLQ